MSDEQKSAETLTESQGKEVRAQAFGEFKSPRKFVAYTVKLPAEQLAALQSIWLELKRLYGSNSPDKSGMIQQAVDDWLKKWDGPEKQQVLQDLLEIRQDTRRRQYKKTL